MLEVNAALIESRRSSLRPINDDDNISKSQTRDDVITDDNSSRIPAQFVDVCDVNDREKQTNSIRDARKTSLNCDGEEENKIRVASSKTSKDEAEWTNNPRDLKQPKNSKATNKSEKPLHRDVDQDSAVASHLKHNSHENKHQRCAATTKGGESSLRSGQDPSPSSSRRPSKESAKNAATSRDGAEAKAVTGNELSLAALRLQNSLKVNRFNCCCYSEFYFEFVVE